MGRAKLKMELIGEEKTRNTRFKKRKEGLLRKMHEFTTLCDVSACMILYGPGQENKPEIWPPNPEEVRRMVEIYKSKRKDSGNKTFGLKDFLDERNRKIEDDLSKLRRRNMEAKYPPPQFLDEMNEGQLRDFALALNNKAQLVREKIEAIKRNKSSQEEVEMKTGPFYPPPPPNSPVYYDYDYDHQQQQMQHSVNQQPMMMLLMNGEDQFGGASSSNNNIQCARSLPRYYAPPPLSYMVVPLPLSYTCCPGLKKEEVKVKVGSAMENGVLTVTGPKEEVKKPEVKASDISG